MSPPSDPFIHLEINVRASNPHLLDGLDHWLQLGLLSERQVRRLCRTYFTCAVPDIQAVESPAAVATPTPAPTPTPTPKPAPKESQISKLWQSLVAEFSVRWLLFLGVFLVILSSGVLAASQWERFPAAAQYLVLLGYTALFWGASRWTQPRPNLTLTHQTLRIAALLLVPVNFWAMDGFHLWNSPVGWVAIAIATPILILLTRQLFARSPIRQPYKNPLFLGILLLSILHWGWDLPNVAVIASYIGTVATAIATFYRHRRDSDDSPKRQIAAITETAIALYAIAILLGRAIFIENLDISQLGLAIGICGWLFAWLSARPQPLTRNPFWQHLGVGLLVFGWGIAVVQIIPPTDFAVGGSLQAIAISGLGLWSLSDRLRRDWRRIDLAGIYLIGWQVVWLIGFTIPSGVRNSAISTSVRVASAENAPGSLLSLTWFPYLLLMLALNEWIRRQDRVQLARFGDRLALGFGAFLALLGVPNPTMRSFNLLLSTATLATVTHTRYRGERFLLYLTHITGLVALAAWIDWGFANLTPLGWLIVALAVTLAEWGFSLIRVRGRSRVFQTWQQSGWHIGVGLAAIAYWGFTVQSSHDLSWGMLWTVVPLALTSIAILDPSRRIAAIWLSALGLGLVQWFAIDAFGFRCLGFGIATVLMAVNTRYLHSDDNRWKNDTLAAILTVGFGTAFAANLLWEGFAFEWKLAIGAILTAGLWGLRTILTRRQTSLTAIYAVATNGWAIFTCVAELLLLTLHSTLIYRDIGSPTVAAIVATGLTLAAILYRGWTSPTNPIIYGLGWGIELLLVETLAFGDRSIVTLAIANIALALATQLLGDWWQRRTGNPTLPHGFHVMPLLYGIVATGLRWDTFSSWTGFVSLGLAWVAVGVGRRQPEFKPLMYLALTGLSISAYELLWYRVQPLASGDRYLATAALSTGILYAYRVLLPWLTGYLRLDRRELKSIAHVHWAIGSIALIVATVHPVEVNHLVGLGSGAFLTRYAIFQGRHNPTVGSHVWVYFGVLEAIGLAAFIGNRLTYGVLLLPWVAAIASVAAYFLYFLPWDNWGWRSRPWRNSAIVLPSIAAFLSYATVNTASLIVVAAFYIGLAAIERKIRFSYFSLVFINWVILYWVWQFNLSSLAWYVSTPALSVLYIAQIDPELKQPDYRQTRHLLRSFATGTLCFVTWLTAPWWVTGGVSLLAIFAGLGLRIRAFLYIGTLVFLLNAFNQFVILSTQHAFLKWIIGLVAGILLIWGAATFETRREQLTQLFRNWLGDLQNWE